MPKLGATWHKSILAKCCNCGKRATRELFNSYNASMGYYCTKCAEAMIKRDQKE